MKFFLCAFLLLVFTPSWSSAGETEVVKALAKKENGGTYHFAVTLMHADSGWEHYADRWEVLGPDGTVLATRVLVHPHVDEQPFTRSLSGVAIPKDVTEVTIRGHDSVHGYGKKTVLVSVD